VMIDTLLLFLIRAQRYGFFVQMTNFFTKTGYWHFLRFFKRKINKTFLLAPRLLTYAIAFCGAL